MSKMGISTVASYRGAQIFEAVGLSKELVDRYFTNTPSRIGGIGMKEIAQEALLNHARAWTPAPLVERELVPGGQYQWRRDGELHLFNPETVFKLQHATRAKRYDIFRDYTKAGRRSGPRAGDAARPLHACVPARARPCRSTRSSRSRPSSSASRPAP